MPGVAAVALGFDVAATGGEVAATGGEVAATGGEVTATGGEVAATGGEVAATGGEVAATGGEVAATGGEVAATGGEVAATGGEVAATGGEVAGAGFAVVGAGGAARTSGTCVPISGGAWPFASRCSSCRWRRTASEPDFLAIRCAFFAIAGSVAAWAIANAIAWIPSRPLMSDAARHSPWEAFSSLIIAVALEALRRRVGVGGRLPYSRRGGLLDWVLMSPERARLSQHGGCDHLARPARVSGVSSAVVLPSHVALLSADRDGMT